MTARVRWLKGRRSATMRTAVPLVTLVLAAAACGVPVAHASAADSHSTATSQRTQGSWTASFVSSRSIATGAAAAATETTSLAPAVTCTDRYFNGMTTAQRVGQL